MMGMFGKTIKGAPPMRRTLSLVLVLIFMLTLSASGDVTARRIERTTDSYRSTPLMAQRLLEMHQQAGQYLGKSSPFKPKTSGSYYYNGYLSSSDGYDNIHFTVTQPCCVFIDITAFIYDMDVALFYGSTIICMPANTSAFGGTPASPKKKTMACFLEPGTYCVFTAYKHYTGAYRVDLDVYDQTVDETEPNDTSDTADILPVNGGAQTGLITATGNVDYYTFNLPYDDYTCVYIGAYMPYLGYSLYDGALNPIHNVDCYDFEGKPDKLVWSSTSMNGLQGQYFIKVKKGTTYDINNTFLGLLYQGPYQVMVKVGPDSLSMSSSSLTLGLGVNAQLSATPSPSQAKSVFEWESSNSAVATVNGSGFVTGVSEGTATITAKARNNVSCSCQVTVRRIQCTSLIIDPSPLWVYLGSTLQLRASCTPSNMQEKISWNTDNAHIASVDENGLVHANGLGKVNITASVASGKSSSRSLTVIPVPVSGITMQNPAKKTLDLGESITLGCSVMPNNATNKVLSWSTSNKKIAVVDGNGKVTAVGKGDATITATTMDGSKKKASVSLKIVSFVHGIALSGPDTLTSGNKAKLALTVSPSSASNKDVSWASSNSAVVTVNSKGQIAAMQVGNPTTVTITATAKDSSGVQGRKQLLVVPRVAAVSVTSPAGTIIDLASGVKTLKLRATVSPGGALQSVDWTLNNKKLARVSADGTLLGSKPGKVIVTATAKDGSKKKASISVQILYLIKGITVSGSDAVAGGKNIQLTAKISPSNATSKALKWSSSNTNVATVDKNGKVIAKQVAIRQAVEVSAGAMDGSGISGKKVLTVFPLTSSMQIKFNGSTQWPISGNGRTAKLNVAITPVDAMQEVNWTTSNSKVAAVSVNGTITFNKAGTVKITAAAKDGSGKKASITFTVSN